MTDRQSSPLPAIIDGDWLNNRRTQQAMRVLERAGYRAFLVGGCVRNALLGVPVTDVDIATNAHPEQVMALAEAAGLRAVPTGFAHGTVTLVIDGEGFEVTTFRRDVQTHGRHAVVAFSDDLAEDAARRDFTMNALYATSGGTVLDPLDQGLRDLSARQVRFVGDPRARIAEDYLRILRFFRFHAHYGNALAGLDAEALAACASGADGLAQLSAERIGAEMRKLLAAPDPAPTIASMSMTGILTRILPGAEAAALAVLVHLEAQTIAPRWLRRLLVLGGSTDRLRLTRAETRSLQALRNALAESGSPDLLGYRLGAELGTDACLARAAMLGEPLPEDWAHRINQGAQARFPLRARDLPHLRGPALGQTLNHMEKVWIASGFAMTRDALLAQASKPPEDAD